MTTAPVKGQRAAVLASYLGWTLDAFDFFLVVLSLTAIAAEFHRSDKEITYSLFLTLACRPIGAIVFGLMADRYGRRLPLMINLVFFSLIEVLSGLAPSYRTFLVLRALFGIGMGGEWGVGAALAMEKATPRHRGLLSALLQEGYATGYLLAALCYFVVFPRWGWRPLFFIGGLPALLAIYVRFRVTESEVWERTRHADWRSLFRNITGQWRTFLMLAILLMAMNLVSHGTQDLYPTFLQRDFGMGTTSRVALTALSMVGALIGGLAIGALSDHIGRRRAMLLALGGGILMIPLWAFAPNLGLLAAGAFLMQFMVQGAWGIIPAHVTELSPDGVRGFMPGFAYQCGAMGSSYVGPWEAQLAQHVGYAHALAVTAVGVCALAMIIVWLGGEHRGVVFGVSSRASP